ncbi:MAG: 4-hydroxythreonine-4-phosphate dehydrogenase PdxA [Phycisphaerales bacterium]
MGSDPRHRPGGHRRGGISDDELRRSADGSSTGSPRRFGTPSPYSCSSTHRRTSRDRRGRATGLGAGRVLRLCWQSHKRPGAAGRRRPRHPPRKKRGRRPALDTPGHTELLAERHRSRRVYCNMAFVAPMLRVILVTAHPLSRPAAAHRRRILATIRRTACIELGVPRPRVAVCGLNPHAGENNLLGDDESRVITPAIHR